MIDTLRQLSPASDALASDSRYSVVCDLHRLSVILWDQAHTFWAKGDSLITQIVCRSQCERRWRQRMPLLPRCRLLLFDPSNIVCDHLLTIRRKPFCPATLLALIYRGACVRQRRLNHAHISHSGNQHFWHRRTSFQPNRRYWQSSRVHLLTVCQYTIRWFSAG